MNQAPYQPGGTQSKKGCPLGGEPRIPWGSTSPGSHRTRDSCCHGTMYQSGVGSKGNPGAPGSGGPGGDYQGRYS